MVRKLLFFIRQDSGAIVTRPNIFGRGRFTSQFPHANRHRVREPDSSFEMARMKVRPSAMRRRIVIARYRHAYICVCRSFLPLSISPFRHVMSIDRALIHPGWQLQFKVVDSTSIVTLFPPPLQHETSN